MFTDLKARTLGLGLLLLAGTAMGAAAQEQMQPLADGFPSEPLTLVVVDEPGSADSVYANQLAEAAQKISPVPINVEHRQDFSNFGTWEALAWLTDQGEVADEGYVSIVFTVPGAIVDLLVTDIKSEVGVDLNDLNVVASTEQLPYFLHQRADAPWGDTVQDLVEYAKANPDTVRYISGGLGGAQDAAMQWYMRELGFTVNTIIGGGSSERALTVAAGDGDVTVSPPDVILPHYEAGRLEVLMASGDTASPEPWADVPNAASMGLEGDPWGQTRGVAVSPSVSEEHRAWLQELYTRAAADPEYVAKREQVPGLAVIVRDGEETLALAQTAYDEALPIMQELGAYWGDQPQ